MSRQASIGGVWARAMLRWCAVACWLTVAGMAVMVFTAGVPWWAAVLALVVLLPLGFAIWHDAAEHREDTERLLRDGRPAVAEVIDLELVDPGDGSADVAVVRLRISGTEVPAFEATYRGDAEPSLRPGARLHATVDPADNLFTLRPLRRS